jgi:molecular chaperone DnaK
MPQIEVTFDIDANGILHVSAKDLGTGREQNITITASSGLSEGEIKKMISDAERHADEDQRRREAVEARNAAENLIYQTEKLLREQGDKVAADKKAGVESAVKDLREAIQSDDTERVKSGMDKLNREMQAVSADLYARAKTGKAQGGPQAEGRAKSEKSGQKNEGDVIDADFEMVDDDKQK